MKIISLSKKRVKEAVELILRCFPESSPDDYDYAGKWIPYSVDHKKENEKSGMGYWVAIEKRKIVGANGLYALPDDKKALWISWFCVAPEYRGKGIGGKLMDFAIKKAKIASGRTGRKILRLYTDTLKRERVARILYKRRGFEEYKREKDRTHKGYLIYMQRLI